jgi:hypothetical protein
MGGSERKIKNSGRERRLPEQVAWMEYQAGPFDKFAFAIGLGFAAGGLYFVLGSFGVLPLPGGPSAVHGPLWLVTCVGFAFGFAGIATIIRAVSGAADAHGELPSGTPVWMLLTYSMMGPLIVASLAAIGSWIAFGPGEREISISGAFFEGPASEWVGRGAFGFGAIVTWFAAIMLARSAFRKILGRE